MPPEPNIITAYTEIWCEAVTEFIGSTVKMYIKAKGECFMMFTGGITAKQLFHHWAFTNPWDHNKIKYYFGDERCVPPDNHESNYGMVMSTLFLSGIPDGCAMRRMEDELPDPEKAAKIYEKNFRKQ